MRKTRRRFSGEEVSDDRLPMGILSFDNAPSFPESRISTLAKRHHGPVMDQTITLPQCLPESV
jgi:hypothetical protein